LPKWCLWLEYFCKQLRWNGERVNRAGDGVSVEYKFTKILKAEDDATWYKVGEIKTLINTKPMLKLALIFLKL